jgi:hypothetical protein
MGPAPAREGTAGESEPGPAITAMLYLAIGSDFACRRCLGVAYRTRCETAAKRAITKARKLRERLGGGPRLLDSYPERPPRMHRRSYYRLLFKALWRRSVRSPLMSSGCALATASYWLPRRVSPRRECRWVGGVQEGTAGEGEPVCEVGDKARAVRSGHRI